MPHRFSRIEGYEGRNFKREVVQRADLKDLPRGVIIEVHRRSKTVYWINVGPDKFKRIGRASVRRILKMDVYEGRFSKFSLTEPLGESVSSEDLDV
jgi:hypothetical protein